MASVHITCAVILSLVGVVLSTCPSGDLSFGGKCYFFGKDIENERRGHDICKARGGQLASINSKAEDDAITQHIERLPLPYSIGGYLIGAQDEITEGTFVWEDGTSLTYSNWGPGQPDNYVSAEDCVTYYRPLGLLSHYQWADVNCDVAVEFYICETSITFSSIFGVLLLFQTTKSDKNISIIYAKNGDPVELSCRFTSPSTTHVWRGPKRLTTYSLDLVINEDLEQKDNILITMNITTGNYILRILNYGKDNEGLYQCESVVKGHLTIYKVEIKSAEEPILGIVNETGTGVILGNEGAKVTLECKAATVFPSVDLHWTTNGKILTSSQSYTFTPIRNDHKRIFTCIANNTFYETRRSIQLVLHYKPYEIDRGNIDQHIYEAELGKPCDVSIKVSSFPKPKPSWSTNAGGKLGVWGAEKDSEEIFTLFSTIVPEISSHLGRYNFVVRNNIGSLKHYIELKSTPVILTPPHAICNISSHIDLECAITLEEPPSGFSNMWLHQINGIKLRTFSGMTRENISILQISFCDYREAGDYVCKWITANKEFSSSARVTVHDQPVISKRSVTTTKDSVSLLLYFLSDPKPESIIWYQDDKVIATNDTRFTQLVRQSRIEHEIHMKNVKQKGFLTSLTIHNYDSDGSGLHVYSCQIQNAFGTMSAEFENTTNFYVKVSNQSGNVISKRIDTLSERSTEEVNLRNIQSSCSDYEKINSEYFRGMDLRSRDDELKNFVIVQSNFYEHPNKYEDLDGTKKDVHEYE
ncbi:FCER2 [Mytilus coruscus]|uniref:FCER2 n=1 Tax=Mytilus coruscus TaxID=42192 RepID=A0A6J8B7M4_MYTCO|nr:FCER2 [Mytilus coruscus]